MSEAPVPLARLFAMAYRMLVDDLHERLADRGWVGVRPAFGFVLLALRAGPVSLRDLPGVLGTAMDDRLHQPYREKLVPGIPEALQFRHEGLLGIAISGSGSSVMAMTVAHEARIAECLQMIFAAKGIDTEALITSADNRGASLCKSDVPSISV